MDLEHTNTRTVIILKVISSKMKKEGMESTILQKAESSNHNLLQIQPKSQK